MQGGKIESWTAAAGTRCPFLLLLIPEGSRGRTPRTHSPEANCCGDCCLPVSTILNKNSNMVCVKDWENCSMAEAMRDFPVSWRKMVKEKKILSIVWFSATN